jgi:alpha-tubulin suppressor-like RCC1 family protein
LVLGRPEVPTGTPTASIAKIQYGLMNKFVVKAHASQFHSVALNNDGTIYTCGSNNCYQYGDTSGSRERMYLALSNIAGYPVALMRGGDTDNTYALLANGTLYAAGLGTSGQLGDGGSATKLFTKSSVPVPIRYFNVFSFSRFARTDKETFVWGTNSYGKLGDGTTNNIFTPYNLSSVTVGIVGNEFGIYLYSSTSCYGYLANDPLVCSQRGVCVSLDNCVCQPMYFSSDCSTKVCFGKNSSDVTTCSGKGICISFNTCSCRKGYYGTQCEQSYTGYLVAAGDNTYSQAGDKNFGTVASPVYQQTFYPVTLLRSSVTLVASSYKYSIFKLSSGLMYGIGLNQFGVIGNTSISSTIPILLPVNILTTFTNNVAILSASYQHAMLIDNNGSLYGWGTSTYGQIGTNQTGAYTQYTPGRVNVTNNVIIDVSCGYYHTAAVTAGGSVYTWGNNSLGQIGDNTLTNRLSPTLVNGLLQNAIIISISCGSYHTMALATDGQLYTWGSNNFGQIGDGLSASVRLLPVRVQGVLNGIVVRSISAGYEYSTAIDSSNNLYTWGNNARGQLGDNTTITRNSTIVLALISNVSQVTTGVNYMIAQTDTGDLYSWGDNTRGQLGQGTVSASAQPLPRAIPISKLYPNAVTTNIVAGLDSTAPTSYLILNSPRCFGYFIDDPFACSARGNCTAQDTCTCWDGYNGTDCSTYTCFGLNYNDTNVCNKHGTCVAPDSCSCFGGYKSQDCSEVATGFLYLLGDGSSGQMGDGFQFSYFVPSPVGGLLLGKICSAVSTGSQFTVVVMNYTLYAFGTNNNYELGDSTLVAKLNPTLVKGVYANTSIASVKCGQSNTIALDTLGRAWVWGYNIYGQLGLGTSSNVATATLLIGLVGKVTVSTGCGGMYCMALTNTGVVYSMGFNTLGQLGDGTNTNRNTPTVVGTSILSGIFVVAISAGDTHALALAPGGVIYGWGSNSYGQLGDGTLLLRYSPAVIRAPNLVGNAIVSFVASKQGSVVVTSTYNLLATGANSAGQVGINSTATLVSAFTPFSIKATDNPRYVIALTDSFYVMNSTGSVQVWGSDGSGQLGTGISTTRYYPVSMSTPYPTRIISTLAAGNTHAAILYNTTSCFGFMYDDPNVCRSRGICSAENNCDCFTGFIGYDCSIFSCNNIANYDPLVCNGHGMCMPNNTCSCEDLYSGRFCDSTSFGYLFAAGRNSFYQLGTGDNVDKPYVTKSRVAGLDLLPIKYVVGGNQYFSIITTTELVYTIGANSYGQFGNGNQLGSSSGTAPVILSLNPKNRNATVVSLSTGDAISGMILSDKTIWVWGNDVTGQLGLGYAQTAVTVPTQVYNFTGTPAKISCALKHCLALMKDGRVYSWGTNDEGQLGDGTTASGIGTKTAWLPYNVVGYQNILIIKQSVSVYASDYHSMALTQDGVIHTWGSNANGQLGDNTTNARLTTGIVKGLDQELVTGLGGGTSYSCAVTLSGRVYCWGSNANGQLGDGTTTARLLPKLVTGLSNVYVNKLTTSKAGHSMVLTSAGEIYVWGLNNYGQLSIYNLTIPYFTSPTLLKQPANYTSRYPTNIGIGNFNSYVTYNGTTCYNILQDDADVCTGNGTCVDTDTCVCRSGFSGPKCQYASCFGVNQTSSATCSGHGTCTYLDTCVCQAGKYTGNNCQYAICYNLLDNDPLVCSSHGVCSSPNNCTCYPTHTGPTCNIKMCFGRNESDPLVCSGKGVCSQPNYCACTTLPTPGYTGGNCSAPMCTSRDYNINTGRETYSTLPAPTVNLIVDMSLACTGHGSCYQPNKCNCTTGWVDSYCSTPICFGKNASNPTVCDSGKNGTCIGYNNCSCLTTVYNGICQPLTCYGKNSTSGTKPCNEADLRGKCVNLDVCFCYPGYGGNECK